ncbi:MAG: right-handed parallel beta-helix repeat-containing protein [Fimbriimonadaceae bacterium]|nr:right-handed parallel beta-helix repeat-containing protein [Fimbriimonadaceae bacterium]
MKRCLLVCCLVLLSHGAQADLLDDFSEGGWQRFDSTPGELTVAKGRLRLVDSAADPRWVTASRVHQVNLDETPWFVVRVSELSDRGQVKLIRTPNDKREVANIDGPGVYAINLKQAFGWSGPSRIEACLYATGDESSITYDMVKYAAALSADEERQIAERRAAGHPKLQVAPFEVVPLFNACGYYLKSPLRPGLRVEFRTTVGAWQPVYPPVYAPEDTMYRGSVVNLQEDTAYELRVLDAAGATVESSPFRTWRSAVPIAKTVVLDATNFDGHLAITESGTPEGWIRYTARDGFVLRNDRQGPILDLYRVKHVILDGLTIRGGLADVIRIRQCEQVRVQNCDIAGWGRIGVQRFDKNGMYYTPAGEAINWDTAILVSRSVGTVLERNYIHDPLTTANSWYYAHPSGPQAVGIDKPRSTVLRYNDFIGSDEHRWNDAIEGAGNFDSDGGFYRDADIYGNFYCFANDDAIEIDGGQINVRVHRNWFEGCLCGVSIQGCMAGPSYVFNNLLVNMGDQRNLAGQSIKTSSNQSGPSAVAHVFGNTTFGDAGDLGLLAHLKIVARNNLFAARSNISRRSSSPQSDCDYNLQLNGEAGAEAHGLTGDPGLSDPGAGHYTLRAGSPARGRGEALPNFTAGGAVDLGALPAAAPLSLPDRPLPLRLDRNQLRFSAAETSAGAAQTITATWSGAATTPFRIAQNSAFDWFTVQPAASSLTPGQPLELRVILQPARMTARALYKGAFLVRLPDGLSRPVMVYAATSYQQAVKPAADGVWTQFLEAEQPSGAKAYQVVADPAASGGKALLLAGAAKEGPVEYRFGVPRAGVYHLLLRVRADEPTAQHDSLHFALDGAAQQTSQLRVGAAWRWCMAAQNQAMTLICLQPLTLTAGEHTVQLTPRESLFLDLVALTDNPLPFE